MFNDEQPDLLTTYEGKRKSVFLGWERPLCDAAADYLAQGWEGGTLNLDDVLVIVPTRQSGRKLRETLAARVSSGGGAVIPPLVITPDALVSPSGLAGSGGQIASTAETLKAWVDVLMGEKLHKYPSLFPVGRDEIDFSWALHTATDLMRLRRDLGENGLLIADAARTFRRAKIEQERWGDLAQLERRLIARLNAVGLTDSQSSRKELAESELREIPGIRRIILMATPDPSPLAVRVLEKYSLKIPVEVAIYAPDSLSYHFDPWGRPEKIQWNRRRIDIPGADSNIAIAANPRRQAAAASDKLAGMKSPAGVAAVGVGDPEVVPQLRQRLKGRGWGAFDPAGEPVAEHTVSCLLRILRDLIEGGSVAAFGNLLRSANVLDALKLEAESGGVTDFNEVVLLRRLDDFMNSHLPDGMAGFSEILTGATSGQGAVLFAFGRIRRWLGRFANEDFGTVLPEFLGWAYSGREFRADRPEDAAMSEVAKLVSNALEAMDGRIFSRGYQLGAKERLDLLLHLISSAHVVSERGPKDVVLQGWLELLWEDAPRLILTGFNEGMVPETIIGDNYLPDAAREILGLRTNEERLARDAYMLTAMIESRKNCAGTVEFLLGSTSRSGDPLRPSRLLFKCSREELPQRSLRLFGTPTTEDVGIPARTFPWELEPPAPGSEGAAISKISVTGFATYLRCPLRFFLRHVLKMQKVEVGKLEMNQADFGNVVHDVLFQLGSEGEMRDCDNPARIREFLLDHVDSIAGRRFGKSLPVTVMFQLESLRERLGWVAHEQAKLRREGWRIEKVEWKLGDSDSPWEISGFPVTGSIDRIDRHTKSGAVRVIDYKTGMVNSPAKDHLGFVGSAEVHPWEILEGYGRPSRWTRLQLPLYALAAREMLKLDAETPVETAYFQIPKAKTDCGLAVWSELDSGMMQSALSCATGVVEQVKKNVFWPPREVKSRYDDFASLLFGEAERAVDGGVLHGVEIEGQEVDEEPPIQSN